MRLLVVFERQRAEVHNLIVINNQLKYHYLECRIPDFDPSQIYETCKQPLFDHCHRVVRNQIILERIEVVVIHLNDPDKMRVVITCNQADHVEAVFQRDAPLTNGVELDGCGSFGETRLTQEETAFPQKHYI